MRHAIVGIALICLACGHTDDSEGRWEALAAGPDYVLLLDASSIVAERTGASAWARIMMLGDTATSGSRPALRDTLAERYDRLREEGYDHNAAVLSTLADLLVIRGEPGGHAGRHERTSSNDDIDIHLLADCDSRRLQVLAWRFQGDLGLPSDLANEQSIGTPSEVPVAPETAAEAFLLRLCRDT